MYASIILCFLPLIAAVLIFSIGIKIKVSHQLIAILLGLLAVFPISIIQFFIPDVPFFDQYPILYALLKSVIVYGLIEEVFKLIVLIPLPHKNYSLLHFLFLSLLTGLSLGCFESVVYLFEHLTKAFEKGAELLYGQIFLRIFTADIIHTACAGLCGIFLFSVRNHNRKISILAGAVFLHGLYDFFAGFHSPIRFFAVIVILLACIECRIKYTALQPENSNSLT